MDGLTDEMSWQRWGQLKADGHRIIKGEPRFGAAELKLRLFTARSFGMEELFHREAWR